MIAALESPDGRRTELDNDIAIGRAPGAPGPARGPFARVLAWIVSSPWRIALLAVGAVLAVDAGGTDDGAGVCVFRRCTGGYCPGCGMTRAARHLTRGEIGAAWQDHPIVVLVAAQGALGAALFAGVRRLRTRLLSVRTLAVVAAINGVLLIVIWVVRLADGSIPRFF
jgi:hypothetical protein